MSNLEAKNKNDSYRLLCDIQKLLVRFNDCSYFYYGSIEIDTYIDGFISGKEFEKELLVLIERLNKFLNNKEAISID